MNGKSNKKKKFKSVDEAFEFLVSNEIDEQIKEEWAKELGPGPDEIFKESIKPKTRFSTKKIFIRLTSAAAVLLLILGSFFFLQKTKPLDQYASNLMQETEISMSYGSESRGGSTSNSEKDIVSLKNELTTVLLNQDFHQALGYFKQLEKVSTLSIEDKYFYAISLLKSKGEDNQKAIRLLNDVINKEDHNLKNALWLRALAYGMTDNATLMKNDLSKLNTKPKTTDKRVKDLLSKY